MKLTHNCPKCGKLAKIQSEFPLGNLINYVYTCGHLELRTKLIFDEEYQSINRTEYTKQNPVKPNVEYLTNDNVDKYFNWIGLKKQEIHHSFKSVNESKCAYEFQIDGIKFAERTQLNCLIADAMGLGKTIQALIALKRNKQVAMPALIIVKGATLFQWAREFNEWVSEDFTSCMPVTDRAHLIPGFNVYILSMDMLSRKGMLDLLLALNLKTVIIDEVQNFKDSDAKRSKALINLIKQGNIQFKIALSGTPIKNKASEYFTILNILAPAHFTDLSEFKRYWLVQNEKGIYTKLNPLKVDLFKKLTSNWIIRRERNDVLKNLPPLTRDYQLIDIEDVNIRNTYNHTLDLFKNWLNDNKSGITSQDLLGWLAQLRSITGQAKCKNAIEWVRDFIESSDESIAIGIQHHSVRDTLYLIFEQFGLNPLKLSGEDNIYRKNDIVRRFTEGHNRILVINSLAGGVGLNLQTCANALVLERQWNSADEEQFEARFHRDGQQKAVTVTYMIAKGTIDEFFHEMVQTKRKILIHTGIGNETCEDSDLKSLLEFSELITSKRI